MPNINILPPSVYNLISAGEVVERPSSVVKELVDNSIDAGATEITIAIKDGGIKQILIIDNGCGMDKDNLSKAFLPHATSKLMQARDLDNIATMGFRGEALASISAIAQVVLSSKTEDSNIGNFVCNNAGTIVDSGEIAMQNGTRIEVNNLFFNTPVRAKFLKASKLEQSNVTNIVAKLIFANPDVVIKYYCDDKLVYCNNGGLENAIYSIYNSDIANNLIPIEYSSNGYRVYGYAGNKGLYKNNRSFQTIIINGRAINNQSIQTAVSQAYGNALMKRCYPVFILNIIMPFDDVDVNVHPNKNEVRFVDNNKVFGIVYKSISQMLAQEEGKLVAVSNNANLQKNTNSCIKVNDIAENSQDTSINLAKMELFSTPVFESENINSHKLEKIIEKQKQIVEENDSIKSYKISLPKVADSIVYSSKQEKLKNMDDSQLFQKVDDNINKQLNLFDMHKEFEDINASNSLLDINIIGQIYDTYIIVESNNSAYIIDQHACHERYLFDILIENFNRKTPESQFLIFPTIIDLSIKEYENLLPMFDILKKFGFDIEEFGGLSVKINAVPSTLTNCDIESFIIKLANEKSVYTINNISDILRDKIAQMACKSAIKAGDKLTIEQVSSLFSKMQNGIPVQCPHGRPAIIELTRNQLDKMFKRIV